MQWQNLHKWDASPAEAIEIQNSLRRRVAATPFAGPVRTVAGVDVGLHGDVMRAAIVVLSYPELAPVETSVVDGPVTFPYVPGLLSFRECPIVLAAWEKLKLEPDLIIVDGQGYAHPRRVGIASHLGLLLDRPVIGCAKSRLIGAYDMPAPEAGSRSDLIDREEIIGAVVRSKDGVSPLFVSIGHKIDLDAAVYWVLACCRGYRLPETSRQAHRAASGR